MPGFNICATGSGPSAVAETAREHRWALVTIQTGSSGLWSGFDDIKLFTQKIQRPSPEIDEVTIHRGQDEIYLPGKNRWSPVEITFYEKVDNGGNQVARQFFEWWAGLVIDIQASRWGADPPSQFKANIIYDMLDGKGRTIYEYHLLGAWPIKVSPSDLDYTKSEISTLTVKLRFDKAIEKPGSAPSATSGTPGASPGISSSSGG